MRIAVTRSGGFAGLVRRGEGDTTDSPELAVLADRADVSGLPGRLTADADADRSGPPGPSGTPSTPGGASHPDAFSYAISLDGAEPVTVPEHLLDGPLRELVETVLAAAPPSAAAPATPPGTAAPDGGSHEPAPPTLGPDTGST